MLGAAGPFVEPLALPEAAPAANSDRTPDELANLPLVQGNQSRTSRLERLIHAIRGVKRVVTRHDRQTRGVTKQRTRRPQETKPITFARQRFHAAKAWKRQSPGEPDASPE